MKEFAKNYHDIISNKFSGLNLTRILDFDEFYNKQILDSALPVDQCPSFKTDIESSELVIDIGFGGGFPLLVLAKMFPNKKFIGLEARGKKAEAVQIIAHDLGLKNIKAYHYRLEELLIDVKAVLSFKAVGPIDRCLNWINTNQLLRAYFYKGPSVFEDEFPKLTKITSWEVFCENKITVPGTDQRYLIGLKNGDVPRGTKDLKSKNLVKVSEFI